MPHQIMLRDGPAPTEAVTADTGFRIRYVAANEGSDDAPGHWDHVAIFEADSTTTPVYEDWHTQDPLPAWETYEVQMEISIPLKAGEYLVAITLDAGASAADGEANPAPYYLTVPLSVAEAAPTP